jgi:hypothetical protein
MLGRVSLSQEHALKRRAEVEQGRLVPALADEAARDAPADHAPPRHAHQGDGLLLVQEPRPCAADRRAHAAWSR